jgi:hypothetical protein
LWVVDSGLGGGVTLWLYLLVKVLV